MLQIRITYRTVPSVTYPSQPIPFGAQSMARSDVWSGFKLSRDGGEELLDLLLVLNNFGKGFLQGPFCTQFFIRWWLVYYVPRRDSSRWLTRRRGLLVTGHRRHESLIRSLVMVNEERQKASRGEPQHVAFMKRQ